MAANRYLIASGDSENPAIYDGGTYPAVDDTLRLNGYVWTVTANRTLAQVRCDALAPAVANNAARQVLIANGVTLTCTTQVQGIASAAAGLIGCASAAAIGTVISPSFVRGVAGAGATETLNIIGYGDTTGVVGSQGMIRGAGTVNWTGGIVNPINYIADAVDGGILNITGNVNQTGGLGIWARGAMTITVNGDIQNATVPFYDTTTTSYPALVHNGSAIAGSIPVIRSRSPYYGTGPFVNNGEVMAISCDRMRLIGPDVQWDMVDTSLAALNLYSASELTGYPLESKVEAGTLYGPSDELEGTMEPWNTAFTEALGIDVRDQILPAILSAITPPTP